MKTPTPTPAQTPTLERFRYRTMHGSTLISRARLRQDRRGVLSLPDQRWTTDTAHALMEHDATIDRIVELGFPAGLTAVAIASHLAGDRALASALGAHDDPWVGVAEAMDASGDPAWPAGNSRQHAKMALPSLLLGVNAAVRTHFDGGASLHRAHIALQRTFPALGCLVADSDGAVAVLASERAMYRDLYQAVADTDLDVAFAHFSSIGVAVDGTVPAHSATSQLRRVMSQAAGRVMDCRPPLETTIHDSHPANV